MWFSTTVLCICSKKALIPFLATTWSVQKCSSTASDCFSSCLSIHSKKAVNKLCNSLHLSVLSPSFNSIYLREEHQDTPWTVLDLMLMEAILIDSLLPLSFFQGPSVLGFFILLFFLLIWVLGWRKKVRNKCKVWSMKVKGEGGQWKDASLIMKDRTQRWSQD